MFYNEYNKVIIYLLILLSPPCEGGANFCVNKYIVPILNREENALLPDFIEDWGYIFVMS